MQMIAADPSFLDMSNIDEALFALVRKPAQETSEDR